MTATLYLQVKLLKREVEDRRGEFELDRLDYLEKSVNETDRLNCRSRFRTRFNLPLRRIATNVTWKRLKGMPYGMKIKENGFYPN
uniref:Uncharacterized protein n=1 Tax=Ascaris lumbricoides TaxID=6252 RepID=A0A0M3IAF7_ASCLU